MFCKHCGSKLSDDADVCTTCGKFVDHFSNAPGKNSTAAGNSKYFGVSVSCLVLSIIFFIINIILIIVMITQAYHPYVTVYITDYPWAMVHMSGIYAFFLCAIAQAASVSFASSFLKSKFHANINIATLIVAALHFLSAIGYSLIDWIICELI